MSYRHWKSSINSIIKGLLKLWASFLAKSLTEKDKCDGKISKAYAIQNNKILNKVAKMDIL